MKPPNKLKPPEEVWPERKLQGTRPPNKDFECPDNAWLECALLGMRPSDLEVEWLERELLGMRPPKHRRHRHIVGRTRSRGYSDGRDAVHSA